MLLNVTKDTPSALFGPLLQSEDCQRSDNEPREWWISIPLQDWKVRELEIISYHANDNEVREKLPARIGTPHAT
jgi:hypothetical protein